MRKLQTAKKSKDIYPPQPPPPYTHGLAYAHAAGRLRRSCGPPGAPACRRRPPPRAAVQPAAPSWEPRRTRTRSARRTDCRMHARTTTTAATQLGKTANGGGGGGDGVALPSARKLLASKLQAKPPPPSPPPPPFCADVLRCESSNPLSETIVRCPEITENKETSTSSLLA